MSYTPPSNVDTRPVAVIGGGTLGRRIAAMFAAGGADVRIFDLSAAQRAAAVVYATEQAPGIRDRLGLTAPHTGTVEATADLPGAVERAWMVVEAVPEKRDLKTDVLGTLDRLAAADAILASNSSSFATSELIDKVEHVERVLNTHYQMPPDLNAVELMSDGSTDEHIIPVLMAKLPQYGLVPFHVRGQSDGFILNRVWAAIKRECLMVVAEGVAPPEDVDRMWQLFVGAGIPPFRLMDRVGLDVVLDIEEHYAAVRPGIPDSPRILLREYLAQGRLGAKTGRGFYDEPG
ncbi:MAG TPA: 3-hydroxyacyl-CoA dehydrogenase family protein [Pseudonocardiaceae bacterium]